MSERVTLYSLLHRFNLDEGECNKAASKAHIEELCKANCTQWRQLPSPLDVETVSVGEIERSTVEESDRRLSFLSQWKQIKGSAATYRQLIMALLGIKCDEDAANVCKLLKRDATVHHYPARYYFRPSNDEYTEKSASSFIAGFSDDVRMDLKQQLQLAVREIINRYASFVSSVCSSFIKNEVSPQVLSSFLLSLPAFKSEWRHGRKHGLVLMSEVRDQLESAVTIYDVIDTLSVQHASYINSDIYNSIVGEFGTKKDHERVRSYFEHLQDYIDRLKLLEYLELHPTCRNSISLSNKLFLRLKFDMSMRVSQLLEWRTPFAAVLGLWGTTLRFCGVEESPNSVIVVFLIPASIACEVFTDFKLTAQQMVEFQALSVLWIKYCDNVVVDFTEGESCEGGTKGEDNSQQQT